MNKRTKWYLAIAIVIIIILAGYLIFDATNLKSCYLYEGHLNRGDTYAGEITDWVIITPYITIYNPNQDSFDQFELRYTIICNGEPVVYDSLKQSYQPGLTSLTTHYNLFSKDYWVNSTDVSENTWQKIKSNTAEWVIQGQLITYDLDDYFFTIEQTGFWEYQG